jgi:hypothetical protein
MEPTRAHSQSPSLLPLHRLVEEHHLEALQKGLTEWYRRQAPPPVLLISGAEGVGKRSVAHWLAQWIFCLRIGLNSQPTSGRPALAEASTVPLTPCGVCLECQKVQRGQHVDFLEILPEIGTSPSPSTPASPPSARESKNDSERGPTSYIETRGGTLKIEQFRELKASQGFSAHEGRFRIVLISDAERMTVQAANSILKLLEEPPEGWIFLLTTSDPTLLLSTIVSRCQSVRLRPFSAVQIQEVLISLGFPSDRAVLCAKLAQGSLGRGELLAQDKTWESRKALFSFLQAPAPALLDLIDRTAQDTQQFHLLLDQLEQITFDLIASTLDGESAASATAERSWLNLDGVQALESHAKNCIQRLGNAEDARLFWMERAERLAQARRASLTPVNRKLLIQDLLVPWLEVSPS